MGLSVIDIMCIETSIFCFRAFDDDCAVVQEGGGRDGLRVCSLDFIATIVCGGCALADLEKCATTAI